MPYCSAVIADGDATEQPVRRFSGWQIAAVLLGGGLLVLMLQRVGIADVRTGLASVGWWFLAVLGLGGLRFTARAQAWRACLGSQAERLPLAAAFRTVLAADAMGNATPLGPFASEPAKVALTRSRVSAAAAVASVAVDNFFYGISALLMVFAGAVLLISQPVLPQTFSVAAQVIVAGVIVALLAVALLVWRGQRWLTRVAGAADALGGRLHIPPDTILEARRRVAEVFSWTGRRLARVAGWQGLFHALAVTEVAMLLRVLPGAESASLLDAFLFESTGRFVVIAFKFIPLRLGVDEAGSALVAQVLGLDPTIGVTLALVRKLRIICWNAVGALLLATRRVV